MVDEIINKVAKANITQIDLSDYLNKDSIIEFDLVDGLWKGLIVKEDHFRQFIKDTNWDKFRIKTIALFCSIDAIIPAWAFMLITAELKKVNARIYFGSKVEVGEKLFFKNLLELNLVELKDLRVMVKGCSSIPNPNRAYIELTNLLIPTVKSLMFGEPCSAVPVFKRR